MTYFLLPLCTEFLTPEHRGFQMLPLGDHLNLGML